MTGRFSFVLVACVALLLSACSAISPAMQRYEDNPHRGVAILARYAPFDDYELDVESGATAIVSEDELEGYGAEVDFLGDGPAFMLGWDEREYGDVDSTEFYAGLRFMLARTDVRPYLAAKVRYGIGLEFPSTVTPGFDSDEFWGWGAGGGLMAFATDHLFFDLNLSYEDVFSDIDANGTDVDLDGWVGTVGVGYAF